MRVLVVNAGSASVRLTLLGEEDQVCAELEIDAPRGRIDRVVVEQALVGGGLGAADVVGHRVVHGGERFAGPARIDARVEMELRELEALAPVDQARSLDALGAVTAVLPGVPAVACFDTTFHRTLPDRAATYALPAAWRELHGLRRYGFYGLSHEYIARRTAMLLDCDPVGMRLVSCHLGAGASLCAIADGRSLDTTMGFTPLDGLVMATRSGSVDPGLILWLLESGGLSADELYDGLEHESGLVGLAGSADMREVVTRCEGGDAAAQLALDVYVHRLSGAIAAMAASMGGMDALVFTGGVGERSYAVRARACSALAFLGVETVEDADATGDGRADREISSEDAGVRTFVIRAREDLEVARQVRAVM